MESLSTQQKSWTLECIEGNWPSSDSSLCFQKQQEHGIWMDNQLLEMFIQCGPQPVMFLPEKVPTPESVPVPRQAPGLTAHPRNYFLSDQLIQNWKQKKKQGNFSLFYSMKEEDMQHLKPLEEDSTQTNFSSLSLLNISSFKSMQ